MSRRDFVALAAVLAAEAAKARTEAERDLVRRIAERIADVCRSSSERFDRGRFLHACGVGD